jgi:hypothetical protein
MWRDFNYPKELIFCANTVVKIVGKENYKILCTNPDIPKELGNVPWEDFDEEYTRLLSLQSNPNWWTVYGSTNYFMSDLIRLYYATQFDDFFYLDVDIQLFHLPKLEEGFIYTEKGDALCMFAVNGCSEQYRMFTDILMQTKPKPMCIYDMLPLFSRMFYIKNFPKGCYRRTFFGNEWKK